MASRIWRPYTQMLTAGPPLFVEKAEGAYLHCRSEDGVRGHCRPLLDAISSWWVITHGHCQSEIRSAIAAQAQIIDQVIFAGFTHEPAELLAELLLELTPPPLNRVFFSDNGSTAVEVALKMAMQAAHQQGQIQRKKFLSFASAYHGDTGGAMSVSGRGDFSAPYKQMKFEVVVADHPIHSQRPASEYVADFFRKFETHRHELFGVIIEPLIQGAGGMIVWPAEALRQISSACRSANVSLIFDEVMTGFGRTGELFAMNKLGVTPDLVCLSKGLTGGSLPLAATLTTEDIYKQFLSNDKSKMLFHGHSFTGNPISCAAALACLKIHQRQHTTLRERWAAMAKIHGERARNLQTNYKLPIADIRLCGTMAAVEITDRGSGYMSQLAPQIYQLALDRGVLLRPLGNVLYLLPPYCVSDQELCRLWDVTGEILESLAKPRTM